MSSFAYGPAPRRRRWPRSRKSRVVAAFLGFVLALSGGALAAWLVQGGGDGYGKAGTLVAPVTVNIPSGDLVGDIFPGGSGSLNVRASNANNIDLFITSYFTGSVSLPDNPPSCSSGDFTVKPVPAGLRAGPFTANASTTVAIPNIVNLSPNASTGCQGVRVKVAFSPLTWST